MRLINADKLKTSLNETVDAAIKWHEDCLGEIMQNRSEATITAFVECILRVKEQPTIDAVEVVRCKDCRYRGNGYEGFGYYVCTELHQLMYEDEYCSRGERREADDH